jgi:hypothetical protein
METEGIRALCLGRQRREKRTKRTEKREDTEKEGKG